MSSNTAVTKVVELNNDNYEQFLNESDNAIIGFYLPWVPNSKRFVKEFAEAATMTNDPRIRYGQVDCTKENDLFQRYKSVPRWPALNLFKSPLEIVSLGRVYTGNLKARAISSWVKRHLSPDVTTLDGNNLESFKKASEVVVIGYMAEDDQASRRTFESVAKSFCIDHLFGITYYESSTKQGCVKEPKIVVYKDFDEGMNILNHVQDIESITKFIKESATPLYFDFLPETLARFTSRQIPMGYFFVSASELEAVGIDIVRSLAVKYKGAMLLGTVDVDVSPYLAEKSHADIEHLPTFVIANPVKHRYYPLKGTTLTEGTIDIFIQDYFEGKLRPEIKSAPVPEFQGPVIEVVADTWDELVINNDKDVFIEYYTQSCGPCKALLPDFTRLAKTYAANAATCRKVNIAKVDAEENDVDSDIRGFPTFKLFPAGSKDAPVMYIGKRRIEDWAAFIQEHGGNRVEIEVEDV